MLSLSLLGTYRSDLLDKENYDFNHHKTLSFLILKINPWKACTNFSNSSPLPYWGWWWFCPLTKMPVLHWICAWPLHVLSSSELIDSKNQKFCFYLQNATEESKGILYSVTWWLNWRFFLVYNIHFIFWHFICWMICEKITLGSFPVAVFIFMMLFF